MRYLAMILAAAALAGCTWETSQNADGNYSRNMRYNQFRPEQHAIRPAMNAERDVRGTNWQKPQKQNETTAE